MTDRYKKVVATSYSADFREAAEVVEEEIPTPEPQQVLVRNKYAAVNATDVNISAGRYDTGGGLPIDLGVEAAGIVVEVGDEVTQLEEGDAVVTSTLGGGYREYNVVHETDAVRIPEPSPEAISVMVSGLTASIALQEVGNVGQADTVLVTAAAGGTGQYAVQLAKRAGSEVIGTCGNEKKVSLLRNLGCDRPINYRAEDVADVLGQEYGSGIDLVYEAVGGSLFDTCLKALAQGGQLLSIGFVSEYKNGPEAVHQPRVYTKLIPKSASIHGFFLPHFAEHYASHMRELMRLQGDQELDVHIDDTTFQGIEEVIDAVEYLQSGESLGKVVVRFPE